MKNIFRIIMIVAIMPLVTGCFNDRGTDVTLQEVFVSAETGTFELTEGTSTEIQLAVSKAQSSDLVINYTITDSNTENGVDYNLAGTSVTIPAGEYSATIPFDIVDNLQFEGVSRSFTVNFDTSLELDGNTEVNVTLIDDDCLTPDIVGTFDVVTVDTSPTNCDGEGTSITVTLVSSNGDGSTTYRVSDITGGLYNNCYTTGGPVPADIVVAANGLTVSVTSQPDTWYGGDEFNGTGVIDACAETMTIMWANGFGDSGTTIYSL